MTEKRIMGTGEAMGKMILFRPGPFLFTTFARCVDLLGWLVPGLAAREFFQLITDKTTAHFDLWALIVLLIAGGLTHIFGSFFRIRKDVFFTGHVRTLLQNHMLKRILKQPGAQSLPESPGEALSRFQGDTDEFCQAILLISDLSANILFTLIAVLIMMNISSLITLVAVIPLLTVVTLASLATNRVQHYRNEMRKTSAVAAGFIAETFDAVQAIKVADADDRVVGHFAALNEKRRKTSLKDRLFTEVLDSILRNAGNLGVGVILLISPQLLHNKNVTLGDLTLFVFYLGMLTMFMSSIGPFWARYTQAGVSLSRMQYLMQGAPPAELFTHEPIFMDGTLPPVLSISKSNEHRLEELDIIGLSFHYPHSQYGIENIDLIIKRGELVVITGRIGSGKTTLLRTLQGLLPGESGEIRWNGEPVKDPASFFVPPRSAYTAQVPRLFSDSLWNNILMGMPGKKEDLEKAIYRAVLEKDLATLEKGLDTLIGSRGVNLSGGQIQRSAAARMFLRDPELFVMDDLSSALDVETEQLLWNRLFEYKAKNNNPYTCLVVSHRKFVLQHADRILVLRNGRIHAQGTISELQGTCDELDRILSIK
jgi:ATP-binding cassette subfamily B protein